MIEWESTCSALISKVSRNSGTYGKVMFFLRGIFLQWAVPLTRTSTLGKLCEFASSPSPTLQLTFLRSGWTVLALDPSSFQVVNTREEFCGAAAGRDIVSGSLNITNSLHRVPGHDRSLAAGIAIPPATSDDFVAGNDFIGQFADDDDDVSSNDDDEEEEEENYQEILAAGLSLHIESSNSTGPGSVDPNSQSNSDEHSHCEDDGFIETESEDEVASGDLMRIDSQLVEDEDLPADWPEFSLPFGYSNSVLHQSQVNSNEAKKVKLHHSGMPPASQQSLPKSKGPTIPTLHLSASHLRLFDANRPQQSSIYCSEPLSFQWPMYHATHPAIDRLNLTQYIPELGIVVIGTQIGRVAVCTLTKNGTKGTFGIRVDWILPFEWQEKSRERPLTHLLGIAVGPVQGHHISRPSSVCGNDDDEDMEDSWLRNRIDEDGVSTTFDPEVIRIRRDSSTSTSTSTNDDSQNSINNNRSSRTTTRPTAGAAKTTKRRRSPPINWRSVKQSWPSRPEATEANPIKDESWRGIEYSRRYRLMLTYYDQTVMTYELSRGRPCVGDPVLARPNWRNREDFV